MKIHEAAKCRTCKYDGELIISQPSISPSTREPVDLAVYECRNELCLDYQWRWIVQSDEEGNVPERDHGPRGVDKDFPRLSSEALSKGRAVVEEAIGKEHNRDEENNG